MKIFKIMILISIPLFTGCIEPIFIGSKSNGFKDCKECTITPQQAYKLAEPYLELSYKLRNEKRNYPSNRLKMEDYILLKGNWYYITRDNYPYKTFWAYLNHAVKIHSKTGEVVAPE